MTAEQLGGCQRNANNKGEKELAKGMQMRDPKRVSVNSSQVIEDEKQFPVGNCRKKRGRRKKRPSLTSAIALTKGHWGGNRRGEDTTAFPRTLGEEGKRMQTGAYEGTVERLRGLEFQKKDT